MRRWAARCALVGIVAAALYGLWQIPAAHDRTHVWPIHSHHFLALFLMGATWTVLGIIVAAVGLLYFLWCEAFRR